MSHVDEATMISRGDTWGSLAEWNIEKSQLMEASGRAGYATGIAGCAAMLSILGEELPPLAVCKAAPDLLAACEAIVAYVGGGADFAGAVGMARAAIAKATNTKAT